MKFLAAADIHGSQRFCALLVEAFAHEGADKLLLLGDILAYAGEASLQGEEEAAQLLNALATRIVCVRGNCDSATNQARLDFPCLDEYKLLSVGESTIFATHGHRYNEAHLPPLTFNILLHGHTHIPACRDHGDYLYLNPGSVSLPRGGSKNSYLIIEEGVFTWKDLAGNALFSHSIQKK